MAGYVLAPEKHYNWTKIYAIENIIKLINDRNEDCTNYNRGKLHYSLLQSYDIYEALYINNESRII